MNKTEEELIWESYSLNNIQNIIKKKYKDNRIVLSNYNKLDINKKYEQTSKPKFKPNGLWYSLGEAWIKLIQSWGNYVYNNAFNIDINYSDILRINNVEKFKIFEEEYANKEIINDREEKLTVNWIDVSKKYKGIEIIPYINLGIDRPVWYSTWDIPSGCIWDMSAIENYNLITNQ